MGKNTLDQPDYRIFKSTISSEQNDEVGFFLHVYTNSGKLKVDRNGRNGCGYSGHGTLDLTVS